MLSSSFYNKKKFLMALFFILLLGIALRVLNLNKYPLWYDEALTVLQSQNIGEIRLRDFIAPLYIFFIWLWKHIGDSEIALRLPSVIFGSLSILMMFFIGEKFFSEKTGLISAFITAISPFQIYYSQEVRMYSLMTLLTLLSVYFLMKSLEDGKIRFWFGFVTANLFNIYSHYIGVLFWLAEAIYIVIFFRELDKKIFKRCLLSNISIIILSFPWLVLSYRALNKIQQMHSLYRYFWAPGVSLKSLFLTLKTFSIGYHAPRIIYLPAMAIFIFFFVKGIFKIRRKESLVLDLLSLILPILTIFLISKSKPLYVDRYFISGALFFYFPIAVELSSLNKKRFLISLSGIVFLTIIALDNYYKNNLPYSDKEHPWIQRKKDHRGVVTYINKYYRAGDGVYHSCRNTIYPFIYYSDRFSQGVAQLKDRNIVISVSPEDGELKFFKIDLFERCLEIPDFNPLLNQNRFWLILSSFEFEIIGVTTEDEALLKVLTKDYRITKIKKFDGAEVLLFEKI